MLQALRNLLESDTLSPHGICLLWRPELIWTHVVSDTLIGLAYFSIPLALAYFLTKRKDVAFSWMVWCFALFITACGTTHFFAIWTLWNADYGIEAIVKAVTAGASVVTAFVLWPLLPKAIALPSPAQLRVANEALQARIEERDAALKALEHETAERLRTEALLHQAQKMEAVGQLTGGLAHDFNNLLTAVLGNLDRVGRHVPADNAEAVRAIRNATAGAERAATLTNQLLAFSRNQPLQPAIHHLNALAENAANLTESTVGSAIELRLDLADHLWPVLVDPNQTENALVNLIVNAVAAMPEGGALTITTRNDTLDAPLDSDAPAGDYVLVEVADTGEGMAEEVLERAFEPFFTTRPLGVGTGLGLSQVFGFVKQSQGHVDIDSAPGRGTRVRIHLPRAASGA